MTVKNLKAPLEGQVDYWCDQLPTFGLRVSQGGSRTFIVMKNGRRVVIGRYPVLSLQQARGEARRHLAELTLGVSRTSSLAFDEALELYLSTNYALARPHTAYEARRVLTVEFRSVFENKRLHEITTHDVLAILDAKMKAGKLGAARHAYTYIRAFFRWALARRYLEASPLQWVKPPAPAGKRDRVLSDAELSKVYCTATAWECSFGKIVLLLLLTGQRRGEIAGRKPEYIDRANLCITLPATVTKNKHEHRFPITKKMAGLIQDRPKGEFIFPARVGGGPFRGWSKIKKEFDEAANVLGWGLHDLRRTFSTNLTLLKVAPHVTERILNHTSGTISGVAAIYNRYSYFDEMREAMLLHERHLEKIRITSS